MTILQMSAFWLFPASGTWLPHPIIFHTGSGGGLWYYWVWNTSGPLSRLTCPWTHLSHHHKHRLPHCNSHQTHRWKTSLTALFICMSLIPGKAEKPLLSFLLSNFLLIYFKSSLLPSVTHLWTFSLVSQCTEVKFKFSLLHHYKLSVLSEAQVHKFTYFCIMWIALIFNFVCSQQFMLTLGQ